MNPIREITREASRQAVMGMKKEAEKSNSTGQQNGNQKRLARKKSDFGPPPGVKVRPVSARDFKEALEKVKKTGETAKTFLRNERSNKAEEDGAQNMGMDMNELAKGMQILQMMMGNGGNNAQRPAEDVGDEIPSIN